MDQLKDILKQALHHRFWIAVGISLLLPATAYFLGASAIQQQAVAGADTIDKAYKAVKVYASGKPINKQYAEIVTTKTEGLVKEVDDSWQRLYDRQAPLLTWPESVHKRFTAWGRQWPKETDASAVQFAIIDYVEAYPKYVTEVYNSFRPFDPATGTGIVAAPPEAALLRPATFSESSPPGLGKVWSAQERLWIQRTLLDVVSKVNKDAKSWDTAVIKQINSLEIGNTLAQDQRSIAKGEALEEAPDITDPNAPPAAEAAPAPSGGGGGTGGPGSAAASYGGGAGGGAPAQNAESVFYIKSETEAIKILPVQMTVLIDQDHIQDFLVALENSPMTIQVRDFEMYKPLTRVTKPEKGAQMAFGMGMGMGSGMGMGMGGSSMSMYSPGMMTGYGGRMSSPEMTSQASMYNTMAGGAAGAAAVKKGVDARGKTREKDAAEQRAKAKSGKSASLHDPYYNIVEVKVFGQARFFNPPPPPPAATPSQADAPADAAAPAEKKADDPEKKAEPAKGDEAKGEPEKKAEPAKGDEAKGEPEKKAEPAKGEPEKKADPAKPKAEPAKGEGDMDAAEKKAEPARAKGDEAKDAAKVEPAKARADEKSAPPAKGEGGAAAPK